MPKAYESGRTRLIKGTLLYLWEEIKTMNRTKFRALSVILTGYIRMKLRDPKTKKRDQTQITYPSKSLK